MKRIAIGISALIFSLTFATDAPVIRDAEVVSGPDAGRLDAYMQVMESLGFTGAVAVSQKGKVILNKGYGYANKAAGMKNGPGTAFDIGSVTKQFTAAAVMLLAQEGKLDTAHTIGKYLDSVPDDKKGITLHHLLTHTSGVTNYTGRGDYNKSSRESMLKEAMSTPLNFKPGSQYRYSNAGYSMLAAIVEMVSGQSYETFVQERLFKPAGMSYTGYTMPKWDGVVISRQYLDGKDNGHPLEKDYCYWSLKGNGGMLALPGDMLRWARALDGDALFNQASKRKMYTPEKRDYAYGWLVSETEYGRCIQHNGGNDMGATSNYTRFTDRDTVIFYAINHTRTDMPHQWMLESLVPKVLFDKDFSVPKAAKFATEKLKPGVWKGKAGSLEMRQLNGRMLVVPSGDQLLARAVDADETLRGKMVKGTAKARELLDELLAGEQTQLAKMTEPDRLERRMNYLKEGLKRAGKVKKAKVYGTIPAWWDGIPQSNDTIVSVHGKKGVFTFRYVWHEEGLGIGGSAIPFPTGWMLQSGSGDKLELVDLIFGKTYNLELSKDGKQATLHDGAWSTVFKSE